MITCKNNVYLLITWFPIFRAPCIIHVNTDRKTNEYKTEWKAMSSWQVGLHSILNLNVTTYLVSTLCLWKLRNGPFYCYHTSFGMSVECVQTNNRQEVRVERDKTVLHNELIIPHRALPYHFCNGEVSCVSREDYFPDRYANTKRTLYRLSLKFYLYALRRHSE